jgi:hypothetical protein
VQGIAFFDSSFFNQLLEYPEATVLNRFWKHFTWIGLR